MGAFRFFISYPINASTYSDYEEITDDVLESSVGTLKQNLASNEYDIGTIKFNKISCVLRNETAKFSEANNPNSIFTYKRDDSILKIEWDRNTEPVECGNFYCGYSFLSEPIEVYRGLLEDNSSKFDADTQTITFNFLGLDSVVAKVQVPYSSLSGGDTLETTVYNILNQAAITKFLIVDAGNINVGFDVLPDDISSLENKTCLEALNDILLITGSVMYVQGETVIVSNRGEGAVSQFIFYGPSSDLGIENLHDVSEYTLGLNRTFNFFQWVDTNTTQFFTDSIETYGLRKKEISSDLITNTTKRTNILNYLLTEFGFPKIELDIVVPMTSEIVNLFLLDKINIDYPADYRANLDDSLPARYGTARYGESRYIQAVSSMIIGVATNWKILNRSVNVKNQTITFKVREV